MKESNAKITLTKIGLGTSGHWQRPLDVGERINPLTAAKAKTAVPTQIQEYLTDIYGCHSLTLSATVTNDPHTHAHTQSIIVRYVDYYQAFGIRFIHT